MNNKPPERYFEFVREVIFNLRMATIATTTAGILLIVPTQNTKNPWLKSLYSTIGVATVGFVASIIENKTQYYQKALRAYTDTNDQIAVQRQWEGRSEEKVLPPATSPTGYNTEIECPEGLKTITWSTFVAEYINNPTLHPHFQVIGETGTGKSITVELIGDKRAEVFNSKGYKVRNVYLSPTVDTNEFLGWELVGNGFKRDQIEDFGDYLAASLVHRYTDKEAERNPIIVVNDEYRWTNKYTDVANTINDVLGMGRKPGLYLISTNLTNLVASQGMQGEGDLRSNYTTILKGDVAINYVRAQENEGLMPEGSVAFCSELAEQHPYLFCVIQNINAIMMLPDLTLYRPYKVNHNYGYKPTEVVELPPATEQSTTRKRNNPYKGK